MLLDQNNNFMSNMLNQRQTLTKLKVKLKERKKKLCRKFEQFKYLAHNYLHKKKELGKST